MAHYAIVLGVSEYCCAPELKACANDARLMADFLKATGKYEILELPGNVTKHEAMDRIESFLPSGESDEAVGEILFYFSGHGHQDDHDMHFVLSSTKVGQINSTALNNSEIDDAVRKAEPHLFVKIIDACQSGLEYIKGLNEDLSDGLSRFAKAKGFENCIFLSSSKKTQSSYAGDRYSQFTKAIVDAAANLTATVIKYIDIQNYLADVFQKNENGQTPFFSTQCDGTEVFCNKTKPLEAFLNSFQQKEQTEPAQEDAGKIARVRSYLTLCREEAAVEDIMGRVRAAMEKKTLRTDWLREFYDFTFEKAGVYDRSSFYDNPGVAKILSSKLESENLFVTVEYESYRDTGYFGVFPTYKKRPTAFHPQATDLPSALTYSLRGKDPNLPDYDIPFLFIYSPSFFYVFTSVKQYLRKGWKDYEEAKSTKYTYRQFFYQDFSEEKWEQALEQWLQETEAYVEKTLLENM